MNVTRSVLASGAVLALAACGGGAASSVPATVTVRGSFDWSIAGGCSESSLPGSQVTITDASGTVLATATLPEQSVSTTMDGVPVFKFAYSATVPAEARYGVTIGGNAPYYATRAQFAKGIDLSC
jgi:hypothetical protein